MATSGRGLAYKLSRRIISRGFGRLPADNLCVCVYVFTCMCICVRVCFCVEARVYMYMWMRVSVWFVRLQWLLLNVAV